MSVAASPRHSELRSLFVGERRLRAGWRILLFVALYLAFSAVGQLLGSFLPAESLFWTSRLMSLAAALAAGWILLARLDGRPLGALGFPLASAAPREVAAGLGVGFALIGGAALLLLASGGARFAAQPGDLRGYLIAVVGGLFVFAVGAAYEEALFRGYPFQVLVEAVGPWPATLLSAALFSWLHLGNPNIGALALANIFLAGVLLSVAYLRTRSLWFATALHLGWNWAMASLLDFPVSGLVFDTPLYDVRETGPDWWTGGSFGPEAGLAATAVLLAGTLWLLRTRRIGPSRQMRALGPVVDRRIGGGWG